MDLNKLELEVFKFIDDIGFDSYIKLFAQSSATQFFYVVRTLIKDKQKQEQLLIENE